MGELPALLVGEGYRALAIDLRGHGEQHLGTATDYVYLGASDHGIAILDNREDARGLDVDWLGSTL